MDTTLIKLKCWDQINVDLIEALSTRKKQLKDSIALIDAEVHPLDELEFENVGDVLKIDSLLLLHVLLEMYIIRRKEDKKT